MAYWQSKAFKTSYAVRAYNWATQKGKYGHLKPNFPKAVDPAALARLPYYGRRAAYSALKLERWGKRYNKQYKMPGRRYRSYKRRPWMGRNRRSFKRTTVPRRSRGYLKTSGFYGRYKTPTRMKAAMDLVEYKFKDTTVDFSSVATTGEVSGSICLIPQGDTESERDGRKCVIKSIWTRLHFFMPVLNAIPTTVNSHEVVKVWCIHDKQANGSVPAATEFLQDTEWDTFRNLQNIDRFEILWVRQFSFNPVAGAGDGVATDWTYNTQHINIYKKVNIPIEYSGTTGSIGTIKSHNIFYVAISEKGLVFCNGRTRVRFVG